MFIKQCLKRIFNVLTAVLLTICVTSQAAYAYRDGTKYERPVANITAMVAENVRNDASRPENIRVKACDGDIDVSADLSRADKGYITISRNDSKTVIVKVMIQKDDVKYLYTINSGSVNLPLQMGDGTYKITCYKKIDGNKYYNVTEFSIEVSGLLDETVFTNSIQIADYEEYSDVVGEINRLLEKIKNDADKVEIVYSYIVNNFLYDGEKAANLRYSTSYIPNLRDFSESGKGICYDYASLFTATLRSNGIPTKLVMGYRYDINKYHAWNEVFLNGKWVVIDTTYGASVAQAGKSVEMICDTSLYLKRNEF